jgi:hypothetical protein
MQDGAIGGRMSPGVNLPTGNAMSGPAGNAPSSAHPAPVRVKAAQ